VELEPTEVGTAVYFTGRGRPTGPMRLAQPVLRIALMHQLNEYGHNLKRILEAPTQRQKSFPG
jgi:hypothetical protein